MDKCRCKFRLTMIETVERDRYKQSKYHFATQYDNTIPEDMAFTKATPNGEIVMQIDNPAAQEFFKVGSDYYFDAVPVPEGVRAPGRA